MYHFVCSAFSGNVFVSAPSESVSVRLNTRFRAAPRRGEHFGPNMDSSSRFSSLSLKTNSTRNYYSTAPITRGLVFHLHSTNLVLLY